MIKGKEAICYVTDKSGRWTCDTISNYEVACRKQLEGNSKVRENTTREHRTWLLNSHAIAMMRMLGLKVRRAVVAKGSGIAKFYGTRKDHKVVEIGK